MPDAVPSLTPHLAALEARVLVDGGFAPDAARRHDPRPDATAWGILALQAAGRGEQALSLSRSWLAGLQKRDGRVPLTPRSVAAAWPTPLAILAWHGSPADLEPHDRALAFLLDSEGISYDRSPLIGHDPTLTGWPWIEHTHSWVEPTALGVMALNVDGQASHPRAREGRELLIDRRLAAGGWNYGNPSAFGQAQRAAPDSTGIALSALARFPGLRPADTTDRSLIQAGLDLLAREAPRLRTPLSLAWALLGLSAWDRRPEEAIDWCAECLDRQEILGDYDTALLALVLFAAHATIGLVGSLSTPR